ncbi:NAD-dependent epimerase/dehydratase family protein, partial [Chloroflexota bacterium]
MKALVIGGTGPTGPYIVGGLVERGYQVSILHRGTHEVELPAEVEHIHGDPHFVETLEEALGKRTFDLVIAQYGRLRYIAEVMKGRTDFLIGIGGLPYKSIVDGFHTQAGAPVPIPEDAPLWEDESVKIVYLMTLTERAVMDAHREGSYRATVLRYPLVYGPRQLSPNEWSIMRRILDGRKQLILPDNGLKLRVRGYAENMAHAVLLAVDQPDKASGQIYNVGDAQVLTLREWVCAIAREMNAELELVCIPFELARPSRPYAGRAHHEVTDIAKIKDELGYEDLVPAEEALRRTVRW